MEQSARDAYFEHCATWGGFDSAEAARGWASQSISFEEQVQAHVALLDRFRNAQITTLERERGAKEAEMASFEPEFVCPECASYDVSRHSHPGDSPSMECDDCGCVGDPGRDFPTARRALTDKKQAERERDELKTLLDEERKGAQSIIDGHNGWIVKLQTESDELREALEQSGRMELASLDKLLEQQSLCAKAEAECDELREGQLVHIVFDGPPSHESGRFIEVETAWGKSISLGEWKERADGYWVLELRAALLPEPQPEPQPEAKPHE